MIELLHPGDSPNGLHRTTRVLLRETARSLRLARVNSARICSADIHYRARHHIALLGDAEGRACLLLPEVK